MCYSLWHAAIAKAVFQEFLEPAEDAGTEAGAVQDHEVVRRRDPDSIRLFAHP